MKPEYRISSVVGHVNMKIGADIILYNYLAFRLIHTDANGILFSCAGQSADKSFMISDHTKTSPSLFSWFNKHLSAKLPT